MPQLWVVSALTVAGFGLFLLARPILSRAERVTGIPWQFYRIAVNPALRRNHALEHATLNVLTQRSGPPVLNGAAVQGGFVLRGWVNPAEIAGAASEGLLRLQAGETSLAYHPRCGTSLATGELLTWSAFVVGLIYAGGFTVGALLFAVGLSWLLSPLAGRLVQRYITTSPDVAGLRISGLTFTPLGRPGPARAGGGPPGTVPGQVVVLVESGDQTRAAARAMARPGGKRILPWWRR